MNDLGNEEPIKARVGNGNDGTVFVKITNKDVYLKIVELEKKVDRINVKVYGIIGGFVAVGAYLVSQGGLIV